MIVGVITVKIMYLVILLELSFPSFQERLS